MTIVNLAAQNDIDDCFNNSGGSSSSLFDEGFEGQSDLLYKNSFNRKKDVQLILEVLECFIQALQDRQASPHMYVQMKLLKIRLLYLTF